MDTEDSSSDENDSSGYEPSSSAAVESSDDPSSESNIPYVDEPSYSAAVESSEPSLEANIPYVDMIDSGGSSEDDTGPSGFTSDELIFKALATVYDDENGLHIDEIFNFIKERYDILEDFREQLEDQLGDLVSECQVQQVGNRYKIPRGLFNTPRQSEVASNATQSMSSEDSTSTKPQDTPSTSSSSEPTAPEENPQIVAAVKEVAEAEHLEFQAKEAQELADKHAQLLKLESYIILQLAVEILNRCANGQKVFLR